MENLANYVFLPHSQNLSVGCHFLKYHEAAPSVTQPFGCNSIAVSTDGLGSAKIGSAGYMDSNIQIFESFIKPGEAKSILLSFLLSLTFTLFFFKFNLIVVPTYWWTESGMEFVMETCSDPCCLPGCVYFGGDR